MCKNKIKAAVVGGGFIGKQHIEAIRRIPNAEVVAIVETTIERAKTIAEQYHIPNYYDNEDEPFALEGIDVIHVCTPNFLHYEMAKKALEHDMNVFCEKPLSLSAEQSQALVDIASMSTGLHAVNLNYRSNVMVREMREQVINKKIGNLLLVQASYIQDWLMYDTDYDWHFVPDMVGTSRAVADIGSHAFDLIQFISGQKITDVFADLITVYPKRKENKEERETFSEVVSDNYEEVEVQNEDAAFIIAKLEDGTKVSITISQVTGGHKNDIEVCMSGSKQSITWKQEHADRLYIGKRNRGNEMLYADAKYVSDKAKRFIALPNGHAVGWADAFKNSIQEFYLEIEDKDNKELDYVDFYKGHYLMKLIEACIESNKTQTWIHVK